MQLICPDCGSKNYECFDNVASGTTNPMDLCVCEECGTQFTIHYTATHITKD